MRPATSPSGSGSSVSSISLAWTSSAGCWPASSPRASLSAPPRSTSCAQDDALLGQWRVDDGQPAPALDVVHLAEAEHASELLGRYLERPRPLPHARGRLRKGRRQCGVEADRTFHFLQDLMNVAVQDGDRAEALEMRERLFAIIRHPAPLRVHRPEGHMGEDDQRSAAAQTLDIFL